MKILSKNIVFWIAVLSFLAVGCNEDNPMEETETVIPPAISGHYLLDTDNDGVMEPIAGKEIKLMNSFGWWSNCYCGEDEVVAVTDEDGYYVFDEVCISNDECKLWVGVDNGNIGYSPLFIERTAMSDSDITPDGDQYDGTAADSCCIIVDLEEGEIDTGNDFTGTIFNTKISGLVQVDSDNDGLGDTVPENVAIWLDRVIDSNSHGSYFSVVCDSDGYYEINGLMPGEYSMRVNYITGYDENGYPNATGYTNVVSAEDTSPDPDGANTGTDTNITVILEDGETDADNIFVIEPF